MVSEAVSTAVKGQLVGWQLGEAEKDRTQEHPEVADPHNDPQSYGAEDR